MKINSSLILTTFLTFLSSASAAVIPYTNDFSGIGSNTALPNEVADAEWTVTGGVYRNSVNSTANVPSTASVQITNASAVPFTLQSQFTVTSVGTLANTGSIQTVGFGAFGIDSGFTGTGASAYYLADYSFNTGSISGVSDGRLRILSPGNDLSFVAGATPSADANLTAGISVVLGTTYTLRLQGTYTGSTLNMTLGLFDSAGTTQIGTSATATDTSALTGEFFGYRDRYTISGGTSTTEFDNFSLVAIPEPSSYAMLLGGLGLLLCFRRVRPPSRAMRSLLNL